MDKCTNERMNIFNVFNDSMRLKHYSTNYSLNICSLLYGLEAIKHCLYKIAVLHSGVFNAGRYVRFIAEVFSIDITQQAAISVFNIDLYNGVAI